MASRSKSSIACLVAGFSFLAISCGNSQFETMIGKKQSDGAISSSGNKPSEPTEDGTQSFTNCEGLVDLVGAKFHLASALKTRDKACEGSTAQGQPACVTSLTFLDQKKLEVSYSDDKALPLFTRNRYSQCSGNLIVTFERDAGTRELHEFTISNDEMSLVHVSTGHVFTRIKP